MSWGSLTKTNGTAEQAGNQVCETAVLHAHNLAGATDRKRDAACHVMLATIWYVSPEVLDFLPSDLSTRSKTLARQSSQIHLHAALPSAICSVQQLH